MIMDVLGIVQVPTWLLCLGFLVGLCLGYYIYMTWHFNLFKKAGIPGPVPVPVFGTAQSFFKDGLLQDDLNIIRKYGKIAGGYLGRQPVLYVADPDLIKQVLVKEFSKLANRPYPDFKEPTVRRTLTILKDDHWRHVRSYLNPAFSANKIKMMIGNINRCATQTIDVFLKSAENEEMFEAKSIMGNYSMDVILSSAFGVNLNSHLETDSDFVKYAKKVFDIKYGLKFMLLFFIPHSIYLLRLLGVRFFGSDVLEFFQKALKEIMFQRKKQNIKQDDLLQIMMDAHVDDPVSGDWNKAGLTFEEIVASAFTFFLGGYDTTSTTLTYLVYCLATNPDCQEKLIEEIDEVMEDQEEVTYEMLSKSKYLQMCIDECLRLYPPGTRVDREVKEDFELNGIPFVSGMTVVIPIYAMNHDPDIWPDPEKFIPERFSADEIAKRHPFQYIPFAQGPRNCIGMKMALTEIKVAMMRILRHLKFITCEKTEVPVKLKKTIFIQAENGVWLKICKRKN